MRVPAWIAGWLALSACAGEAWAQAGAKVSEEKEVMVFAAASLREAFEGLAAGFEGARPGVKVRLNLAGSQELRTQIEQGAKADVLASADLKHMAALDNAGLVGKPAVFARNEPVVVVPRDNPAAIRGFTDLPKAKRLVVGAPEVPIGSYTQKIFGAAASKYGPEFRAKLDAHVVSRELNVRQVLAKVSLGEADAGIVYRTDALAAKDKVATIAIPADVNVVADYPIAAVKSARAPKLAAAFVALVLSPDGQKRLAASGFVAAAAAPEGRAPAPAPAR